MLPPAAAAVEDAEATPTQATDIEAEALVQVSAEEGVPAASAPVLRTDAEQAVLDALLYEAARAGRVEQAP